MLEPYHPYLHHTIAVVTRHYISQGMFVLPSLQLDIANSQSSPLCQLKVLQQNWQISLCCSGASSSAKSAAVQQLMPLLSLANYLQLNHPKDAPEDNQVFIFWFIYSLCTHSRGETIWAITLKQHWT